MSRRPSTSSRRPPGSGLTAAIFHPKSRPSPLLSVVLGALGVILVVGYLFRGSGLSGISREAIVGAYGDSCTLELQKAIPVLKKTYGDSMLKVLHVGPDSCSVISKLLKEKDTEAWGIEPYDVEDAGGMCKTLVNRGFVRVADIKFPLIYRENSFSLVIVSDALDYLSPKYLNKTLPDLARLSSDGLVIFTGSPGQSKAKVAELSKFGRPVRSLGSLSLSPPPSLSFPSLSSFLL
ncbi:OLC1v1011395C1 [Oldenlandia corymbosa var. corymbosa]|uniref:OLC1v1011395C1 n=1 Tax=Oldenlandia corymbosa var. corymbosa TaxID=529605 RepID=A0AAV1DX05_OLDCO|nr:OLC1v1011395C1 [Oldenlandia corymbosa var. corymbosa]